MSARHVSVRHPSFGERGYFCQWNARSSGGRFCDMLWNTIVGCFSFYSVSGCLSFGQSFLNGGEAHHINDVSRVISVLLVGLAPRMLLVARSSCLRGTSECLL